MRRLAFYAAGLALLFMCLAPDAWAQCAMEGIDAVIAHVALASNHALDLRDFARAEVADWGVVKVFHTHLPRRARRGNTFCCPQMLFVRVLGASHRVLTIRLRRVMRLVCRAVQKQMAHVLIQGRGYRKALRQRPPTPDYRS